MVFSLWDEMFWGLVALRNFYLIERNGIEWQICWWRKTKIKNKVSLITLVKKKSNYCQEECSVETRETKLLDTKGKMKIVSQGLIEGYIICYLKLCSISWNTILVVLSLILTTLFVVRKWIWLFHVDFGLHVQLNECKKCQLVCTNWKFSKHLGFCLLHALRWS